MTRSLLAVCAALLVAAPCAFAQPTVDGDLSDAAYVTLATKLNANAGFGPDIDVAEIVYFADKDAEVLYVGLKGKLNQFSTDGIGLWLNFDDPVGAPAGTLLGDVVGAEFNYLGAADSAFTADFEVDYAFSINPGATSTSAFFDAVTYVDSTRSDFLGEADQMGTTTLGPADGTNNTGGPVFFGAVTFAFDNAGSGDTGLEFAIPFSDLGIDASDAGSIHGFAFVVSSTAYFSNVTVPGNVTAGNLGFDPDFDANLTSADCSCDNPSSAIGTGPFHASKLLCPPAGPAINLSATGVPAKVAQGSSFTVTYAITNDTANPVSGDLFYTAARAGNTIARLRVRSGTLPPGFTLNGSYVQPVPANAPPGGYTYTVRIGNFPNLTVDAEAFNVTVVASGRVAGGAETWEVTEATPWETEIASASRAEAALGAYPNPFARTTTIQFETDASSEVRLAVFDVTGREVALLVDGTLSAGRHEATFDARGLASGLYVYRLEAGDRAETGRLTLVR